MNTVALVRSMSALLAAGQTGVLTVRSSDIRTFLYVKAGEIVFAEEETQGETLGRLLVRQCKLTLDKYREIINKMTDALFLNEQLRFGEVAVELGYLTETQVSVALAEQMRWKVVRCFLRREPDWAFEESESRVQDVGYVPMVLEGLVLDAARFLDDDLKLSLVLGSSLDERPMVEGHRTELGERYGLDAPELAFVRSIRGDRTLRDILRNAPEGIDAHAVLTALALMKHLKYVGRTDRGIVAMPTQVLEVSGARERSSPRHVALPRTDDDAPPPPREESIHDGRLAAKPAPKPAPAAEAAAAKPRVLPAEAVRSAEAMPEASDKSEATAQVPSPAPSPIEPVVPDVAATPTPPLDPTNPRDRARAHAATVLAKLKNLRADRLETDLTPKNPHAARLLAEQAFQRGRRALASGRDKLAQQELARALELMPMSPEYALYAEWSSVRESSGNGERLELLAFRAQAADPNAAFPELVLGERALGRNEIAAAHKHFLRAQKADPQLPGLASFLRVCEQRAKLVKS